MAERDAARALRDSSLSLRNAAEVIRELIETADRTAAGRFADYARRKALDALDAAIEIAREPSPGHPRISPADIGRAEAGLGIGAGTFASCFGPAAAGGALPA